MVKYYNPIGKDPFPKNNYGIIARHTMTPHYRQSPRIIRKIINGPIAAIEKDYQAEIRKTADFRKVSRKFDPVRVMLAWRRPLPESCKIII